MSRKLMALVKKAKAAKQAAHYEANPDEFLGELRADAEATKLQAEQRRHADVMDPEYWSCIVFQSREQKMAVLRALGLPEEDDKYVDGNAFIRTLGLKVPEEERPRHRLRENKRWQELAAPLPKR